jgi:hypothetical protein
MQYTNKFNWAPELVTAILKDRYTDEDERDFDESASTLTAPTQMIILKRRYPDQLVIEDVSDMFWRFLGSIAHSVLEEAFHAQDNGDGSFVEKRLYLDLLGKTISGKLDLYSAARQEVRDYKSTKVYKIIKGDYIEWENGQNIYAYLLRQNDFPVKKLTVIALIFDFKPAEAYKKNYPSSASVQIDLPLWNEARQLAYITERVQRLLTAETLTDTELTEHFPCSDTEMWSDIKDWAIFKQGAQRATACFDTEHEALAAFTDKKLSYATHQIVKRMTGRTRCLRFCPVRNICGQNKALLQQEGKSLPEDREPCIF